MQKKKPLKTIEPDKERLTMLSSSTYASTFSNPHLNLRSKTEDDL